MMVNPLINPLEIRDGTKGTINGIETGELIALKQSVVNFIQFILKNLW
jgi:hypothetical protein